MVQGMYAPMPPRLRLFAAQTPNHFSRRWESKLSDERQSCGATSVARASLAQVVIWGGPFSYFRRLLVIDIRDFTQKLQRYRGRCTTVGPNEPHWLRTRVRVSLSAWKSK